MRTMAFSNAAENPKSKTSGLNVTLWVIQALLALLFLFAGAMKFMMPLDVMVKGSGLPGYFIRFIGVAEILGALGLLLPGMTRLYPIMTSLAAAGLTVIMAGAVVLSLAGGIAAVLFPLIAGLLAAFVAYGRWRLVPHRDRFTGDR